MADSPANNAGSPAIPSSSGDALLAVDQRGVTRPDGAPCDIGAYEGFVPSALLSILYSKHRSSLPGLFFASI